MRSLPEPSGLKPTRMQPVVRRLSQQRALSSDALRNLEALGARTQVVEVKATLQTEDDAVYRARYVVAGWACRKRLLSDGRRQVFGFILPGDGVGVCLHPSPLANATTAALTRVELVDASDLLRPDTLSACPDISQAISLAANEEERRLLDHLVRLGRLDAIERVAHLLLELHDRLAVIGLAEQGRFPLPLTQEVLADALGLSVVHINRTLQDLRRQQLVMVKSGECTLLDRDTLTILADYNPREPRAPLQ